jgi:mono/diheme cytochrome c family protein
MLPILISALVLAQPPTHLAGQSSRASSAVARGRYLVEDVVICTQCHTPRTSTGELDRSRWLMGAPVFYQPSQPMTGWADVAPRLAGLPPGTDQEVIRLLTMGIARTGAPPRPPMLPFHMTRADAEAVLAYLKSLKPAE